MIFKIWNNGDGSVGIPGNTAALSIDLEGYDEVDQMEMISVIKEIMVDSFKSIWNDGFPIYVKTDAEIAADMHNNDAGIIEDRDIHNPRGLSHRHK